MCQLVGMACVNCQARITNELDARFCLRCGRPVHDRCARPHGDAAEACEVCGADPRVAASLERQRDHDRMTAIRSLPPPPPLESVKFAATILAGRFFFGGLLATALGISFLFTEIGKAGIGFIFAGVGMIALGVLIYVRRPR